MLKILLVSSEQKNLDAFAQALALDPKVSLFKTESAGEALKIACNVHPQLAVIDSALSGKDPLKLVSGFIALDAMINTVVVSGMDDEEFHEASEGLGILARLPEQPGAEEAARILSAVRKISVD
jgi:DNA-binding NarL/FixJ family response regulator